MYLHEYFYRQGNLYFERVTNRKVYIQPKSSGSSLEKHGFSFLMNHNQLKRTSSPYGVS